MAALYFLLPTGHSRSGRRSFDSKLISLPPLDEAPVHVHRFRLRPLRFARLPVPVWNPYSRGRLSPAKSEDRKGGEGKTDANLTIFFSTCCAMAPQLAATPWGGSPPRPLCQKICYSDCTKNCPLCPLGAPRRFRNPKNRPATRVTAHSASQCHDRGND